MIPRSLFKSIAAFIVPAVAIAENIKTTIPNVAAITTREITLALQQAATAHTNSSVENGGTADATGTALAFTVMGLGFLISGACIFVPSFRNCCASLLFNFDVHLNNFLAARRQQGPNPNAHNPIQIEPVRDEEPPVAQNAAGLESESPPEYKVAINLSSAAVADDLGSQPPEYTSAESSTHGLPDANPSVPPPAYSRP